ncbi:lytic transglycosylase domain-containing protein [Rothia amarae]|uniref:Lytic transglycosylase domain-containing protein n=1 Tax=Rothia amarae TaxID=169480 RepID=A0A7H2BJB8_9MICC|nr:lytic transglycosylase domain-containing protein [Rothia amarae]QNV39764.1 lytic transglycosylase domain-containing protein [Rothia amarae]
MTQRHPEPESDASQSTQTSTSQVASTVAQGSRRNPALRIGAGILAHWQVLASGLLLGAGVIGLHETYEDYCGRTDLTYAPNEVRDAIELASEESGFRTGIIASQVETESDWRTGASSHAGAKGLAQFTDETWAMYGQGDPTDPSASIAAQGRYLGYLKERLAPFAHNDDELLRVVLAGYNAGPAAVEEYKGIPPFGETQAYVTKITELADTKYKVTCDPDPQFSKEKLHTIR